MMALLQRVSEARVVIDGTVAGEIGHGFLVLVCAERGDTTAEADKLLAKVLKLRVFSDDAGKMNRSVQDLEGGLLIVSQFTLAADLKGGNRPSFTNAAPPALGRELYEYVVAQAKMLHPVVETGEFGADMKVQLINDGPVTIPMHFPPSASTGQAA
ncbi:MAG: D-tyrosyl-tRNA(Tyr) deacylase [Azoarcus sp.]|nr:MAG: D-tyrosyl-tRNA(Tyr) deacylase [Azoarcus sp.]